MRSDRGLYAPARSPKFNRPVIRVTKRQSERACHANCYPNQDIVLTQIDLVKYRRRVR